MSAASARATESNSPLERACVPAAITRPERSRVSPDFAVEALDATGIPDMSGDKRAVAHGMGLLILSEVETQTPAVAEAFDRMMNRIGLSV